jgi:anaerobic ribonucleoside-triphosphate reductase activating protein
LARDTWSPESGIEVSVERLTKMWCNAVASGATGLTISGGEPGDQPEALLELLASVNQTLPLAGHEIPDILMYTGYEFDEFNARVPGARSLVDALITGPYDVLQPTTLIWRGSANQRLQLLTPLGIERYETYVDYSPDKPAMQVLVDDHDIWYVGVPRSGDLARIERAINEQGVTTGGASWRP